MSPTPLFSRSKTSGKLWILGGGGGLILIVLFGGIFFFSRLRNTALTDLKSVQQEHERIQAKIQALPQLRKSRDELFLRLRSRTESYLLFHRYRNYHLTAREYLLPLAITAGLQADIGRESNPIPMPATAPKSTKKTPPVRTAKGDSRSPSPDDSSVSQTYALYPVTITATGSYQALVRFIQALEAANPLVVISELAITGQPRTPEDHLFSLSLLWPIWKDLDLKPKVQDLIMPSPSFVKPQLEPPEEPEEEIEPSPTPS